MLLHHPRHVRRRLGATSTGLLVLATFLACTEGPSGTTGTASAPGEQETGAPLRPGDAAEPDAGKNDSDRNDAALLPEAGAPTAPPGTQIVLSLPDPESSEPFFLSQTGLYVDEGLTRLSADVVEFTPRHELWSDGAEKLRFLRLPPGEVIDTSDMTSWVLPVGTLLWKQFTRDGVRVETRLVARTGWGERDYWMGAFLWNESETDARFVPNGREDARGTPHDVPTTTQCGTCHNGERGRALGVSAVQLAGASPFGLREFEDEGLLSDPPEPGTALEAPGTSVVSGALGYLHANCGHCHNPRGSARPDTDLNLRLVAGERTAENTPAYLTTIDVPLQNFTDTVLTTRVVPGEPEQSALWFRMTERGTRTEMPPLASDQADALGVDLVRQWIEQL